MAARAERLLCPPDVDEEERNALLAASVAHGDKRYATDGERAFEAQEHKAGAWHGYPVGWKEVPEPIRGRWVKEQRLKRQAIRRNWERSS